MSPKPAKSNRIASAIVLLRGQGPSLEVYLAERAPQLRFFGGYHAFIGGVREPIDGRDDADGDDRTAMRNCALRELFEETGVLVDADILAATTPEQRAAVRRDLLDLETGTERWNELLTHSSGDARLREFCRITTPPFAPVRYATAFFVAELPAGQEPEIVSGELVGGGWWNAAAALEAWRRGEIQIVPPALILLECLASGDVDRFCAEAKARTDRYAAGELHHVRFSPGVLLAPLETPTIPPATTTNCLLVGTESIWVIDPASHDATEHERLFAMCDELTRDGARIAGVLSTHHHPDHVGGIAAVCRRYDVEVRAHEITLARLPDGCPHGEPLADGDRIDLGRAPDGSDGWELEALFTPGHDRGHLCFRETRYGALVAGDMVSTISTIMIDPPEGHLATYVGSLERLAALSIGTLYPAHGPAVREGNRVLDRFLTHRRAREESLVAALATGLGTIEELVPVVYSDTDPRMHAYASRSLRAGLDKLCEEGRARQQGDRWSAIV
ncbi:MAG: MBL fold metallo-hydrolase [Planctomycetes bacterium]|nr:MBL fold metallo-hydrolase [Planctomycetota bacterium]